MPRGNKVIAVNRFYWPDQVATSQILTDLAVYLAGSGRSVAVVTSRMLSDDPAFRLPAREERDGVEIRRVWTTRFGRHWLPGRAIDFLSFYLSAFVELLRIAGRGDFILAKTDPPGIAVVATAVARLKRSRLVTWNQDLFPEVAEALGALDRGGVLARTARWLRNLSLRSADANVAISEAMAERIAAEGVERSRIAVVHNWSSSGLEPVPHSENPLRRDWGFGDAFVIGYSGNLGRAHIADAMAELVRRTHDLPGLVWLFVGGGHGLSSIRRIVEETGTEAVRFEPYQPREALKFSLSACDMHLVALSPECEGLIMPSKLYGIMAVARPVLFLGDPNGAVAREIAQHRIGLSLDAARPESWRASIDALRHDSRLAEMASRARHAHQNLYRAEISLGRLSRLLHPSSAIPGRSGPGEPDPVPGEMPSPGVSPGR